MILPNSTTCLTYCLISFFQKKTGMMSIVYKSIDFSEAKANVE